MLLFISRRQCNPGSFSYVSIHLMLLFILKIISERLNYLRFNTSHVTLYRSSDEAVQFFRPFQYISCYSLSCSTDLQPVFVLCFNTSHITLYRQTPEGIVSSYSSFNTSHVTLYRLKTILYLRRTEVSIHLMLLFICVCRTDYSIVSEVSIHLMLLFIGFRSKEIGRRI